MPKPIELKAGDKCPACDGDFKQAKEPTDEQYRKSVDRENPEYLPAHYDTASPEFRAEHGVLHRCSDCGYQTRFVVPAPDAPAADDAPANGKKKKKGDAPEA